MCVFRLWEGWRGSTILPFHVESGRYTGTEVDQRLCRYCELGREESDIHFLLYCPRLTVPAQAGLSQASEIIKQLFAS